MNMNRLKLISILFFVLIIIGCRKYPKNKIFIIRPEDAFVALSGAKVSEYKVNGADSMSNLLLKYPELENTQFIIKPRGICGTQSNCCQYVTIQIDPKYKHYWECESNILFSADKKYIYEIFSFMPNFDDGSPFIRSRRLIIKLTAKEMIVQTIHNNKIYELKISK